VAFTAQEHMHSAVAIVHARAGDLFDAHSQHGLVLLDRLVEEAALLHIGHAHGVALAAAKQSHQL
jgi:hypothetical protein